MGAKRNARFKATIKARGACRGPCNGKIFTAYGPTERAAKRSVTEMCHAAGCHRPDVPYPATCNCGHVTAHECP